MILAEATSSSGFNSFDFHCDLFLLFSYPHPLDTRIHPQRSYSRAPSPWSPRQAAVASAALARSGFTARNTRQVGFSTKTTPPCENVSAYSRNSKPPLVFAILQRLAPIFFENLSEAAAVSLMGKSSGAGKPPANEIILGSAACFRISRTVLRFIKVVRCANLCSQCISQFCQLT